jgi:enamine deaminase RidA (YjgF/YER057c/UK114 family)
LKAVYNRAVTAVENLQRLGIEMPEPPAAVGAYVTWVRTGNLVLTSGQLPWRNKTMLHPGRLGSEVSVEDGYQAARQAGLNAIAQLKSATGDLERIRRIVRLEGYVHCAPGFRDHPKILDGASDLLLEIFEERGKHVRLALGIPDMPLNACVQLGVWAEVSD